jgi:hypothetical protein
VLGYSELAQPPDEDAVLAFGVEIGEYDGDRLADNATAVHRKSMGPAEVETCGLEIEQFCR